MYKRQQNNGSADVCISEFDKDGKLVYATYFGGYQYETAHAVAVDKWDNVAIVGETKCVDGKANQLTYPVTANAFQKDTATDEDCIITIFDANWQLKYSTLYAGHGKTPHYYNGDGTDIAYGCTFDNDGYLYLCGTTSSYDFPTSPNAYKSIYDSPDAFILKFDGNGNRIWATLYGGSDLQRGDIFYDISFDNNDNLFLTGITNSPTYPIIKGGLDSTHYIGHSAAISLLEIKLNGKPIFSDYYSVDLSYGYEVEFKKNIYISGETEAYGFPYTQNAIINWNEDISQEPASCYLLVLDAEKLTSVNISDSLINIQNIIIYPNPVFNELYVFNKNFTEIINLIEIYDLYGRKIIEKVIYFQDWIFNINTSSLLTGFYTIQIHTNKDVYSIKIIKY